MMRLNNLKFSERAKLRLLRTIFPVERREILLLDRLEVELKEAGINYIDISAIFLPQITNDSCPAEPELAQWSPGIEEPEAEDLSAWLEELLLYPPIESFAVSIGIPRRAGKSYGASEAESRQISFPGLEDEDKRCIHGLKKNSCSICIEKERQAREKVSPHIDPFDLIFPILQPPLGGEFDNPIAFPPGMELYDFQREGVKFLAEHERALLGDEMGLGKSIQAIVAIRFLVRTGRVTNGLILCPKSVLTDWEKKLWDWAPELRVVKVRGMREQRQIWWNSPAHIYLTTYETLRQDLSGSLGGNDSTEDIVRKQFDFAILDEIQKVKNPGASVTKATRMIDAQIRWGLSGTPLENRLEELVSIFAYLKPGLLHYDNVAIPWKMKEAIKPYFLRRRKIDVLPELPEKICEEVWLELSPGQREAYDRAEQEGIVALNEQGDSVTVQHVLALITKLKQICNMDPVSKESCKLEYLLEKLEEISEQEDKVLVFSQYPDKTLKFLEPELKQFSPLVYHGSLSYYQRDDIVRGFQEEEDSKVLLMSVKAGGLGLTLTRANHVFHFDLWWNPSVADQAEGRVHRIGQKKTVFVTSLFTMDTIEKKIQDILARKRELFKEVIDDLSDTHLSKALTKDELFSLFNLQKGKRATPKTSFTGKDILNQSSPQQFERLVADLYEKMGYQVKLTPQTRDQGIDIYAKHITETGTEYLAIQCKHYPNGVVGVEHARSLYGVIQAEPGITKGILVTSGEFSRECKEFARGKRIELFDSKYLRGLLEKYNASFLDFREVG